MTETDVSKLGISSRKSKSLARIRPSDRCDDICCRHKRRAHRLPARLEYAGRVTNDACEKCPCWTYKERAGESRD